MMSIEECRLFGSYESGDLLDGENGSGGKGDEKRNLVDGENWK